MNRLIDACISHYRAVLLVLALVFIVGSSAYVAIPKEQEPDIQIPIIYVSMQHEGISPEDGERLLIRPMEEELRSIEGVKEMTAIASEGHASVTLEFNAGFDNEKALSDVREKVDLVRPELPEDTDEPTVNEVNLSLFPVLNVILKGNIPERGLLTLARNLRDKIEALPNVLSVDIAGEREEVVDVIIEPKKIEYYGISADIASQIALRFNSLVAAGNLDTTHGRYAIKVPGLLENIDDIMSLPIKAEGDAVVQLRDIASIRKTFKDATGYARVNGESALVLEVSKRTGTNIIETVSQVKALVAEERAYWPQNLQVLYAQDKSNTILDMLSDLQNNILLAVLLVMALIMLAVGVRSSLLVSIAIPGAFLMGVMFIALMGMTMNIVVLFSLILSVGMLVDSAIVVCEMADRLVIEGKSHRKAYAEAAKYMKWPIISSTATTLIVFLPLLFWPGIVGEFMRYMPITLIATLTGSMLMAIIFIPCLGTLFGKSIKTGEVVPASIRIAESGELEELQGFPRLYYKALSWVLDHAKRFTIVIFLTLCGVYVSYSMFGTGVEFFPDVEPEFARVQVKARGNLSTDEKDVLTKQVEARMMKELGEEVRVFYARSGSIPSSMQQTTAEDAVGIITIEFTKWNTRRKANEIMEDVLRISRGIPGILVDASGEKSGPKSAKPIELQLGSRHPELLEPAVEKILAAMKEIGGFRNLEDTRPVPAIEWNMAIDRAEAARYGADVPSMGTFIKMVTTGMRLSTYRPDDSDEEVDLMARFPKQYRTTEMLDRLKVITEKGAVPLGHLVTREAKPQVTTIRRADGLRVITIKSDVAPDVLADQQVQKLREWFQNNGGIDPRINVTFKGDDEEQKEAGTFLRNAFVLALFGMALILVIQFNSFYAMGIILSAVFLSTVGVLLGLLITGQPFGIVMCGVGIISLAGIVVNNNIIFIDTYDKLRIAGKEPKEALLRTGLQRLRPILLTSVTTVLGLLPMVTGLNIDFIDREITLGAPSSQWWKQLSVTIAGGLSFATILTLFFTPGLLMMGAKRTKKRES